MTSRDDRPGDAGGRSQPGQETARPEGAAPLQDLEAMSAAEIRQTLHELRAHQAELEMQNEELRRTHADLDAARVRSRDLYDLAPVGYITVSKEGVILEANLTAAALLGVTRGSLLKQSVSRFILKEDQDTYYLYRKQLLDTGEPQACELRMLKNDGTQFWAHLAATAAPNAAGEPVCRVVLSDVSEHRQAESRLGGALAEAQRFREALDHVSSFIYMKDPQSRYVYANLPTLALFGCAAEELVGCDDARFFPPDAVKRLREIDSRVFRGEQTAEEIEVADPEGGRRVYWELKTPIYTEPGSKTIWGLMGISTDITERQRAAEALRESLERFQLANRATFNVIWDWDLQTDAICWNENFQTLFGYRAEEIGPDIGSWTSRIHPEDLARVKAGIAAAIGSGQDHWFGQYRFRRKDGVYADIEDRGYIAQDASGRPVRMIGAMQDITERKRAEAANARLESQLQQAQKMESVGRLAGGVAHDFNNLLMGIMNYVELCRDELPPGHPVRSYLDEITSDAQRSAHITQQLLAFARKQIITPEVLDLNDALAGMLKMLGHLLGEDIGLAWVPGADLWPVRMDPGQIDQILVNLCVNARDAIAGVGRLTVETANVTVGDAYCAARADAAPGEYVMLAVSDTGCGMSKDVLAHLFEPFYTTKGVGQGTGLGLATVYGIVKQNAGWLDVDSEPGKGTTFRLYLPRSAAVAAAGTAPAVSPARLPRGQETILLAEDEKSIRVTMRRFLEPLGYTVLAAAGPEEALRLAGAHSGPIHLLITDVVMPGLSGRDLAARLAERYPTLKCLFMSGYTADVIAHRGILDQNVQFLSKPFSRDELAHKVRDVLERQ